MAKAGPAKIVIQISGDFLQIFLNDMEVLGRKLGLSLNLVVRRRKEAGAMVGIALGKEPHPALGFVIGQALEFLKGEAKAEGKEEGEKRLKRRGIGHILYITLNAAISYAIQELSSKQVGKSKWETGMISLLEARCKGSVFKISLRAEQEEMEHHYLISKAGVIRSHHVKKVVSLFKYM